ncbi:MAG: hypothetical protein QGG40_18955, partial [Myxococcota bacterium]|nr:hypothetical protein [Myxococcota bacterium]
MLERMLLAPLRPDVFVHTWDVSGQTHKQHAQRTVIHSRGARAEERISYAELESLYRPCKAVIEPFPRNGTSTLAGVSVPQRLLEAEPVHHKGSLPMFYKIWACNQLKVAWERARGFRYDIVIRLRPDLLLGAPLPDHVLRPGPVLWHSNYAVDPAKQVSDKFAVASSENMDHYASVWNHLAEYWRNPLGDHPPDTHRVGERLLWQHTDAAPYETRTFTM